MNILNNISILWTFIFTLVGFVILFESRYSRKKTLTLSGIFMGPLIVINIVLFILLGPSGYIILLIPVCTIPSCIFFWILARYRDGRFSLHFAW